MIRTGVSGQTADYWTAATTARCQLLQAAHFQGRAAGAVRNAAHGLNPVQTGKTSA